MTGTGHFVAATCYLQIEPEWMDCGGDAPLLAGARVVRMTQRQPMSDRNPRPSPGAIVVAVKIRVPVSTYDVPRVVVELPVGVAEVEGTALQLVQP